MTESDKAKIIALREKGATYKEIGNEMGLYAQQVYQVLYVAGKTKPKGQRTGQATTQRDEEIIADRKAGLVYQAIAVKHKIATTVVHKVLRAAGMTNRRGGAPQNYTLPPLGEQPAANVNVSPEPQGNNNGDDDDDHGANIEDRDEDELLDDDGFANEDVN